MIIRYRKGKPASAGFFVSGCADMFRGICSKGLVQRYWSTGSDLKIVVERFS